MDCSNRNYICYIWLKMKIITFVLLTFSLFVTTTALAQEKDNSSIKEVQNSVNSLKQKVSVLTDSLENKHKLLEQQKSKIAHLVSRLDAQRALLDSSAKALKNQQTLIKEQQKKLSALNSELGDQDEKITNLNTKITSTKVGLDSLAKVSRQNSKSINHVSDNLGARIKKTKSAATAGISRLDKKAHQNRLYWIIGILATLLIAGILYWLLQRRIYTSKNDVESQIKNTRKSLEEESVQLDNKLVEVLEKQLKLEQEKQTGSEQDDEIDHSLALKVADEITRIQKNLHQMDDDTRGLKQLTASVKRIRDNFASNDYELVEMLGKEFDDGIKAATNFIPSDEIETGKQIITRIIKPQVNFKGEMIQSAQIEVSVGE